MGLDTNALSQQLTHICRRIGEPQNQMLTFWTGAFREVEQSLRCPENSGFYPFLTEPMWRFSAHRMTAYVLSDTYRHRLLSASLQTFRDFSQKDAGHFLQFSAFDGRAYDHNAFRLVSLFGLRHEFSDIDRVLSAVPRLLGIDRSIETYGAVMGILHGAYILNIPAHWNELERLKEMKKEALVSGDRYRLTIIPNDRWHGKISEERTSTPEWAIEKLDRDGKTKRTLIVEVKNRNGETVTDDDIFNLIHNTTLKQLLDHKFNHKLPHHDSLIIIKFYKSKGAEKRLLEWVSRAMTDVLALHPDKIRSLRRVHIKLIFDHPFSGSINSWLDYREGEESNTWQARQTSASKEFHPGTLWQEPFPRALNWKTT